MATPKAKTTERTLVEAASLPTGRKPEKQGGFVVLKGVKLLGTESKNVATDGTRAVYPFAARERAVTLYEGAPIFEDHAEPSKRGIERRLADRMGNVKGVVARDDGTYGDAWLYESHPRTAHVAFLYEHDPAGAAFSHVARTRGAVRGKDWVVEAITSVQEVDLVSVGGTVRSMVEAERSAAGGNMDELVAELLEALNGDGDVLEKIKAIVAAGVAAKAKLAEAMGEEAEEAAEEEPPAEEGAEKPAMALAGAEARKPAAPAAGEREQVEALRSELAKLKAERDAERETARREKRDRTLLESHRLNLGDADPRRRILAGLSDADAKVLVEGMARDVATARPTTGGAAFHSNPGALKPLATEADRKAAIAELKGV